MKKHIEVVIPCYNEEACVNKIYDEIRNVAVKLPKYRVSILFIDDGSTDSTLKNIKILEKTCEKGEVHHISFARNFGKEAGIYAGLKNSVGDYVALMDADLQHPPELLIEMTDGIMEGYECCGARRISRNGESVLRSAFSRVFYKLMNKITQIYMEQGTTDYRLMSRKFVNAVLALSENNRFTKGIFSWVGFDTKWINYENIERTLGETKWSFRGLVLYAINGVVAFTTAPLQCAIYIGISVMLIAVSYAIFIIIQAFRFPDDRTGYSSIIAIVLLLGGILIMLLGVIGEYLAKIYIEVKKRPIFIEKESFLDIHQEKSDTVNSKAS